MVAIIVNKSSLQSNDPNPKTGSSNPIKSAQGFSLARAKYTLCSSARDSLYCVHRKGKYNININIEGSSVSPSPEFGTSVVR